MLLRLHKALLESERMTYEQANGPIQSKGEFFQLVVGHEWFNWLRPISQFIVQIDEAMSGKEPITSDQAHELLRQARHLLKASESGTPNEQRYYEAIQRDADIAFMHLQVTRMLAAEG